MSDTLAEIAPTCGSGRRRESRDEVVEADRLFADGIKRVRAQRPRPRLRSCHGEQCALHDIAHCAGHARAALTERARHTAKHIGRNGRALSYNFTTRGTLSGRASEASHVADITHTNLVTQITSMLRSMPG